MTPALAKKLLDGAKGFRFVSDEPNWVGKHVSKPLRAERLPEVFESVRKTDEHIRAKSGVEPTYDFRIEPIRELVTGGRVEIDFRT